MGKAWKLSVWPFLLLALACLAACAATPNFVSTNYAARAGSKKVLVAYGSWAGSTGEVADAIGKTLAKKGLSADVRPVQSAGDPKQYSAVILGSAIRMGKVHGDVLDFAKKHKAELADKPVVYFLVCMAMKDDTPENRRDATTWLVPLENEVKPLDVGLFAGKLDRAQLGFFDSTVTRFAGGTEGDHRDWDAIRIWSEQVAGRIVKAAH